MKWKSWSKKTLVLSFVTILLVMGFNYVIDSTGLFYNKSGIIAAAKEVASGNMIAGWSNYDDRNFQKHILNFKKEKIDITVLGSSRAMEIRKDTLNLIGNQVFLNNAVSSGSLDDYLLITAFYQSSGYLPDVMILALDPWIFNSLINTFARNNLSESDSIEKIIYTLSEKDAVPQTKRGHYFQLINLDYTISNIMFLLMGSKEKYYLCDTVTINDYIVASDGSHYYPYNVRFRKTKEISKIASDVENGAHMLQNMNKIGHAELFERFILYLKSKKVEVIILLLPYNPISYKLLIQHKDYKIIQDVELYLNRFAVNHNIRLLGSYNPEKYNFKVEDFFDAYHPYEVVSRKILKDYLPTNK